MLCKLKVGEIVKKNGAKNLHGAKRAQPQCYSEDFSHYSEIACCNKNSLHYSACNMGKTDKNQCFLTTVKNSSAAAQKHGDDSAERLKL